MNRQILNRAVRELALLWHVQTAYYDVKHGRHPSSIGSLVEILRRLGAPVETAQDAPSALRERKLQLLRTAVDPVAVAWDGGPPEIHLRLPAQMSENSVTGELALENGEKKSLGWKSIDLPLVMVKEEDGARFLIKKLELGEALPPGYHRLSLDIPPDHHEVMIISTPAKAYTFNQSRQARTWGLFIPLYSLHSAASWGCGDLSDLENLIEWVTRQRGGLVATLPLLPLFLEESGEPSPYAPVSRLVWNELYVDVARSPELSGCAAANDLLASVSMGADMDRLRRSSLVDYQGVMALKRRVLEVLSRCFFTGSRDGTAPFRDFIRNNPVVGDYAAFRAVHERKRTPWHEWPPPLREGSVTEKDFDPVAKSFYLYTQWLLHQQMRTLSEDTRRNNGLGLFLDFSLGVSPNGFDAWRYPDLFVDGVSVGAPPDPAFTSGQNWGFPPMHPESIRQEKYTYFKACIQHHLRHAGILRIDHIMGLHRLFWIPAGMDASDGVYVRYNDQELYGILTLESHRNHAVIVGEDLGTVPPEVRPAMKSHAIHQMYIIEYEMAAGGRALRPIPSLSVASLNTHDMPPFASFWQEADIEKRVETGLVDNEGAAGERLDRRKLKEALVSYLRKMGFDHRISSAQTGPLFRAVLRLLSSSPAQAVIINLEDLWLETEAQNIPGVREHPNWRRKARYDFETFSRMPELANILREVDLIRRGGQA
ncbi:MAG: 4-alpha-glucanotransferase [Dehalococcoidia bacterium]|nr:4-alpha-glucanotransferase [Dehalococcoidia bacterium]